jgi:hypothetical protein
MFPRLLRPLLVLVALITGCSPTIDVEVLKPAKVSLGGGRRLTVVQAEGRPSAREFLIDELILQTREDGFFTAEDRSYEGMVVRLTGNTVVVYGGTGPAQTSDEIGMRFDVYKWDALRETRIVTETAPDGSTLQREEVRYVADVILGVTAFNVRGQALMAEYEYHTGATAPYEDDALEAAGTEAIHRLLLDITPTVSRQYIRIDDEDEGQESIIEVAQRGNLNRAIEEMQAYVEAHPDNASAHYNLAVMLDATGQYRAALDSYTRAIELHRKDFYVEEKADCARRLADWEALQN